MLAGDGEVATDGKKAKRGDAKAEVATTNDGSDVVDAEAEVEAINDGSAGERGETATEI